MTNKLTNIVVLGIGNLLWADEGFGVRSVEALQERYEFSPNVQLIDGGTQGLYLIEYVQTADALLILDAVDYGLAPGQLHIVKNDEVPKFLGAKKMSLHQTGFQEVLQLALLTEQYPDQVVLIGCQPEVLEDYGGSLTPTVKQSMYQALDLAVQQLKDWGVDVRERTEPLKIQEAVSGNIISLDKYESGRPSENEACRVGDDRFLAKKL